MLTKAEVERDAVAAVAAAAETPRTAAADAAGPKADPRAAASNWAAVAARVGYEARAGGAASEG